MNTPQIQLVRISDSIVVDPSQVIAVHEAPRNPSTALILLRSGHSIPVNLHPDKFTFDDLLTTLFDPITPDNEDEDEDGDNTTHDN